MLDQEIVNRGKDLELCPICHFWRNGTEMELFDVFIQAPEGKHEIAVEGCGSCYAWLKAKNFLFDEGVPT